MPSKQMLHSSLLKSPITSLHKKVVETCIKDGGGGWGEFYFIIFPKDTRENMTVFQ